MAITFVAVRLTLQRGRACGSEGHFLASSTACTVILDQRETPASALLLFLDVLIHVTSPMSGLSEAGSLRYAQQRSSLPKKRINNGDLSPPVIHLDSEGMILRMSDRVRQMLEYRSENSLPDCFLSLVHGRNLRQVMRDIGRMAAHHKKRADWLVRLQTGQSRWRWYRISAANRLGDEHGAIVMRIEGPVDCGFRW